MSKIPKPRCTNCDGFGQLDKHHPEWTCTPCHGTGTTNQAYIELVERLRASL